MCTHTDIAVKYYSVYPYDYSYSVSHGLRHESLRVIEDLIAFRHRKSVIFSGRARLLPSRERPASAGFPARQEPRPPGLPALSASSLLEEIKRSAREGVDRPLACAACSRHHKIASKRKLRRTFSLSGTISALLPSNTR